MIKDEMKKKITEQLTIKLNKIYCSHNKDKPCNICMSRISGNVSGISGNVSRISGNVSEIYGDVSGISGNVSEIYGNVSGISGNVLGISGNVSRISGNVSGISGDVSEIVQILSEAKENERKRV